MEHLIGTCSLASSLQYTEGSIFGLVLKAYSNGPFAIVKLQKWSENKQNIQIWSQPFHLADTTEIVRVISLQKWSSNRQKNTEMFPDFTFSGNNRNGPTVIVKVQKWPSNRQKKYRNGPAIKTKKKSKPIIKQTIR